MGATGGWDEVEAVGPSVVGGGAGAVEAFVALLVRALDLDRVVFLIEDGPGRPLRCVARHGPPPKEPLVPAHGDPRWSAIFTFECGPRRTGHLLLARANGAPLDANDHALARRLADAAGAALQSAALVGDLEHARALLERADRLSALGTLAAGVAHEIRNPLVSVRTFIQLLPERVDDEEFRTSFRELALKEIERVCGLITDLLAFSRHSTPAEREPTDLNEVASQIARLLEPEARKRDVALVLALGAAPSTVLADEAQVKQVLMNVVLNAIEACEAGGIVEVRTHGGDVVEVADTGIGMTPDQCQHIFEPFFTTKEGGNGLGLYIAQRIVADHGGTITARSEGRGTTFTVTFARPEGAHAA